MKKTGIVILQYGHNALAASFNRLPGVQAVREPMVMTRRAQGDQRRGDIEWDLLNPGRGRHSSGPGSQRLVSKGTDTIPGKAAALCDGKKTKTYSDQASFVSFIVETGGRINAAGLQFLSRILPLGLRARLDVRGGTARHLTGTGASTGLHACTDCRGDTHA
jgi:hypothetical protein